MIERTGEEWLQKYEEYLDDYKALLFYRHSEEEVSLYLMEWESNNEETEYLVTNGNWYLIEREGKFFIKHSETEFKGYLVKKSYRDIGVGNPVTYDSSVLCFEGFIQDVKEDEFLYKSFCDDIPF